MFATASIFPVKLIACPCQGLSGTTSENKPDEIYHDHLYNFLHLHLPFPFMDLATGLHWIELGAHRHRIFLSPSLRQPSSEYTAPTPCQDRSATLVLPNSIGRKHTLPSQKLTLSYLLPLLPFVIWPYLLTILAHECLHLQGGFFPQDVLNPTCLSGGCSSHFVPFRSSTFFKPSSAY
ncbi:hypothetical protein VTI74DRAFT_637 [Chaetomium olivicolor]